MSSANKNLISKVHSGMWGDLQTSLEEFGRSRYVTTGDSVRFVIVSSNFSPIRNTSLFRRRFANVVVLSCSNSHITVMLNNLTQRPKELFTEVFKYVPVSSWWIRLVCILMSWKHVLYAYLVCISCMYILCVYIVCISCARILYAYLVWMSYIYHKTGVQPRCMGVFDELQNIWSEDYGLQSERHAVIAVGISRLWIRLCDSIWTGVEPYVQQTLLNYFTRYGT